MNCKLISINKSLIRNTDEGKELCRWLAFSSSLVQSIQCAGETILALGSTENWLGLSKEEAIGAKFELHIRGSCVISCAGNIPFVMTDFLTYWSHVTRTKCITNETSMTFISNVCTKTSVSSMWSKATIVDAAVILGLQSKTFSNNTQWHHRF